MIDFDPSEEQALIVETVRQFAENEIRPLARACDESRSLPDKLLEQAHELGLVANGLPEAFGGGGERSAVTGCLIAEELAWGDLSIALGILCPSLLGFALSDSGSEEQKQAILPALAGSRFAPSSLALVEPRFASDAFRPWTVAQRDGDEYLLEGQKCQVPWLESDQPVLVIALEDDVLQGFLVPREVAGLSVTSETNMGIRALPTVELDLASVRLPASSRLGGEAGADIRSLINRGRVGLSAMAIGVARAAFEVSRDYAKERETFGAPIATRQSIAFKLADMAIEIDAARLLIWEAAWLLDQGRDITREAVLAHGQARKVALQVADGAVQVFGGHGYIRDHLPELHLRNAAGFDSFEALTLV
ncbi:MAG: acyl-CoA dehydrogenase family protein [Deltaproteobacteria bacterium]|nr:acyl-CoA dehydrogenase family protein [Deltaproteobacteria bacterium]